MMPLEIRRVPKRARVDRAREWLSIVGLSEFENHYPRQLSGGMQKRCSIARTMVYEPEVLLMDEPFGALDAITKTTLQKTILDLWQRRQTSVIFITHDLTEAIALSDRVAVMTGRPGRIRATFDVPLDAAAGRLQHRRPARVQGAAARALAVAREELRTEESRMSAETSMRIPGGQVGGRPRKRAGKDPASTGRAGLARFRRGRRKNLVLATQVATVLMILGPWQLLSGPVIQPFLISNPIDVAKKLVGRPRDLHDGP